MDVIGLGFVGAGLMRGGAAPEVAPRTQPPKMPTPSMEIPTIVRRTGKTIRQLREEGLDRASDNRQAQWEAEMDKLDANPADFEAKPLNTENLQKMLGDMFEPKDPSQKPPSVKEVQSNIDADRANRAAFPMGAQRIVDLAESKGISVNQAADNLRRAGYNITDDMLVEARGARYGGDKLTPGHFDPPIQTVEDLQNLAVWGKTKGPYKLIPPREEFFGAGTDDAAKNRLVQRDMPEIADFQREIRTHTEMEKEANAQIRDQILDNTANPFGGETAPFSENVLKVLPQKLLRPNSGPTLNEEAGKMALTAAQLEQLQVKSSGEPGLYYIMDGNKSLGHVSVTSATPGRLIVDMIESSQSLGIAGVKKVFKHILEDNPDMHYIDAERISGVRMAQNPGREAPNISIKVRGDNGAILDAVPADATASRRSRREKR